MQIDPPSRFGFLTLAKELRILIGLLLIIGVGIFCVRQLQQRLLREVAPKEIQQLLDAQVEAWNQGDLDGFMAGYWKSDQLRFHSGNDITLGWQPTYDRYQKRYKAEGKRMGQLSFSEVEINAETYEFAVVRGRWRVVIDQQTSQGLFTLILRKFDSGWQIVYDHTSAEQK